jgi:hyaluronan synthase
VIVDGVGELDFEECLHLAAIAKREGADKVLLTTHRKKRENLRSLLRAAEKAGLLYETTIFVDSDTVPDKLETIEELLRPFGKSKIGGVTTTQRILDPETYVQRVCDWLERARAWSSMAAASLFEQVPCLPGRMYAVRTWIVMARLDELVEDYLDLGRLGCWMKTAGDDRRVTNFVLDAGYGTVMAPKALVYTTAPADLETVALMWERWGRSSQWYTIQFPWYRHPRLWMAAFLNWGDILITVSTLFIVFIHWPYVLIFGNRQEFWLEALMVTILSMLLTTVTRQVPYLLWHAANRLFPPRHGQTLLEYVFVTVPYNFFMLFMLILVFTGMMLYGQVIRGKALATPNKIGKWGTRKGADGGTKGKDVWEYPDDPPPNVRAAIALQKERKTVE